MAKLLGTQNMRFNYLHVLKYTATTKENGNQELIKKPQGFLKAMQGCRNDFEHGGTFLLFVVLTSFLQF